jgi:hypothetical protein
VVDTVEALGDVGIQHILGFKPNATEDGFDRIVAGPSRAKPVTVWFETSLPLRFHRQLDESLCRSVTHSRNTQSALLLRTGLGNPNPSQGLCWPRQAQVLGEVEPLGLGKRAYAIHPRGPPALVVLRHPTYREALARSGRHQQFFETMSCSYIPTL